MWRASFWRNPKFPWRPLIYTVLWHQCMYLQQKLLAPTQEWSKCIQELLLRAFSHASVVPNSMIIVHYKCGVTTRSLHLTRAAQLVCPGANIFFQGVQWLNVQLATFKVIFTSQNQKLKLFSIKDHQWRNYAKYAATNAHCAVAPFTKYTSKQLCWEHLGFHHQKTFSDDNELRINFDTMIHTEKSWQQGNPGQNVLKQLNKCVTGSSFFSPNFRSDFFASWSRYEWTH